MGNVVSLLAWSCLVSGSFYYIFRLIALVLLHPLPCRLLPRCIYDYNLDTITIDLESTTIILDSRILDRLHISQSLAM